MGKRIIAQRRGRGSPTFRALTHKRVAPSVYPTVKGCVEGILREIVHEPGRGAPVGRIELEDGREFHMVLPEGVAEGQKILIGDDAPVEVGNVLPVGRIPEGIPICNIERRPCDGGKLVKSSGAYATVLAHAAEGVVVKLPSGKATTLHPMCRATVGVIAGAGRVEKPFLRAGKKFHWMRAKGRYYPRVRGVAMYPAAHPFGGHAHKPTTVSRHAPPGAKVGHIAAKRTGRRKK